MLGDEGMVGIVSERELLRGEYEADPRASVRPAAERAAIVAVTELSADTVAMRVAVHDRSVQIADVIVRAVPDVVRVVHCQ